MKTIQTVVCATLTLSMFAILACKASDKASEEQKPAEVAKTAVENKATGKSQVAEAAPAPKPGDLPAPSDVAAPPSDAKKTKTGLAYKSLNKGTGDKHPEATSRVTVHYSGWTTDGKMFDSSVTRGQPATFSLNGVIAGWTEGLQLMVEGEKTRFWIPEDLAYKGRPGRPQGMLVFDVELIKIKD